jgi:hypothetical protein
VCPQKTLSVIDHIFRAVCVRACVVVGLVGVCSLIDLVRACARALCVLVSACTGPNCVDLYACINALNIHTQSPLLLCLSISLSHTYGPHACRLSKRSQQGRDNTPFRSATRPKSV